MTLTSYLQDRELWHREHERGGFLVCVDDLYGEPESLDPAQGHVAHACEKPDGSVVLELEPWCGYGDKYHLRTVEAFAKWWDDAMAMGFRELHWDDYDFVD